MTTAEADLLLKRITVKEGMMSGKPTIRGMRFPVKDVLELLYSGMTWDEILEEHPILERDDIKAALLYASLVVGEKGVVSNAA
jgi:uncharacterized protein (DUF433 family)